MQTGQHWQSFHFEERGQWYLQPCHLSHLEQEHASVYLRLNRLIHHSFVPALELCGIVE